MSKLNTPQASNDGENLRAADSLVVELEARIVSGQLPDNQPLPSERELMVEFDSSRTVVREAIAALNSRGLVESKPRFRPIVRKPDYRTVLNATDSIIRHMLSESGGVRNLYESRVFIERGLVRVAAESAKKEDIILLKAALSANYEAIDNSLEFYKTDMAFHGVLYEIPQNPIYPVIHKGYVSWLAPHWERMERSQERNENNYIAHKRIYNAILERDPQAAEIALSDHLESAWRYVKGTFQLEEAADDDLNDLSHK